MTRRSVVFVAPRQVTVETGPEPSPGPGEVLLRTLVSAISPGTELLIYRGELPEEGPLDTSIAALAGDFRFPLRYGYALVGRVEAVGEGADPALLGSLAFAFHPHDSHAVVPAADLIPLPDGISPELATFIPNLETAVNLVMDGAPLIGERVVVFGQGVVGLLTTALLARFPLGTLVTLDRFPRRRARSLALGATASLDPAAADTSARLAALLDGKPPGGADLCFELSGNPAALDLALATAGYTGRVVVGSWYGRKRARLDLGGRFHRARQRVIASQVSTIAPELSGRWTKARRFATVLALLPMLDLEQLMTHRFVVDDAPRAYELLDQRPDEAVQVLLIYGDRREGNPCTASASAAISSPSTS